jgi:hypothetical protein
MAFQIKYCDWILGRLIDDTKVGYSSKYFSYVVSLEHFEHQYTIKVGQFFETVDNPFLSKSMHDVMYRSLKRIYSISDLEYEYIMVIYLRDVKDMVSSFNVNVNDEK